MLKDEDEDEDEEELDVAAAAAAASVSASPVRPRVGLFFVLVVTGGGTLAGVVAGVDAVLDAGVDAVVDTGVEVNCSAGGAGMIALRDRGTDSYPRPYLARKASSPSLITFCTSFTHT